MRPEEWLGSTSTRFGEETRGLSKMPNGKMLRDEIRSDPIGWLGETHVEKFGNSTEILVKLLDPDQRLPVHYHPNREFAKEKLQLNHGKTEGWIILDAPAGAQVGVGFKCAMKKNQVADLMKSRDSTRLLDSLKTQDVRVGDVVFVPAGVPHVIDAGIFVLELQEPTDLSILLEWEGFAVDGDTDGHLNLGFDVALDALRLEPLSQEEELQIISRFEANERSSHAIFKSIADNFFRADYLTGDDKRTDPGFGIFLVLDGNGVMKFSNASPLQVSKGDAVVIPYSAGNLSIENCLGILSRPPKA